MITPRSFLYSRQQQQINPRPPSSTPPTSTLKQPQSASSPKRKDDRKTKTSSPSSKPANAPAVTSHTDALVGKRDEPPNNSTRATMTAGVRHDAPTSAVRIPVKTKPDTAYTHKARHHHVEAHRRHSAASQWRRQSHDPDAVAPSVAALLAVTSIPRPNRRANMHRQPPNDSRMTVDCIIPRSQVSEKELSQELRLTSLSRSPMDMLLTPPEDLLDEDEDASVTSDSALTSTLSTREGSFDSLPSLGNSFATSTAPSVDSPWTPRIRRFRQPRRSLEPVSSPPGELPDHPLSVDWKADVDQVEFKVFDPSAASAEEQQGTVLMPLKTAFKSNLTSSLRALRSAARSLSAFTASSIPAEDLLTRSILTSDPGVPFTDERRPPVLEEEPNEAMRRYLNPTSSARLDLRTGGPPQPRIYTASIQMQTYKIQKSKSVTATANRPAAAAAAAAAPQPIPRAPAPPTFPPGPRQREIRENSDFIRIAVMEHLMRKSGKLDDAREGHARWLLPPRKSSTKPYEIGADGVPTRWVSLTLEVV